MGVVRDLAHRPDVVRLHVLHRRVPDPARQRLLDGHALELPVLGAHRERADALAELGGDGGAGRPETLRPGT